MKSKKMNFDYSSGLASWWTNSKSAWAVAKNISPAAFWISIFSTGWGLIASTISLLFVEPVLNVLKQGNLQESIDKYLGYIGLAVITYVVFVFLKPYVLFYFQQTFKHVRVKQKLFVKDILLYVPYMFNIDSERKYKIHRFGYLIDDIFSVAKDQAEMVISLVSIIIGFSIGSKLDIVFLLFMVVSTLFSLVIENKKRIQNFRHSNDMEENLLEERLASLSIRLDFPSLSTHLANQIATMRNLFFSTQSQVVDRELYRKRNNLIADRKASLFDILMKVIIFGYVFYSIKKGKTFDAFAIYYVSSRVCNYIRSFGQCIVQQNENTQSLEYVVEIINISNSEKFLDEQKLYPNISEGIEIEFRNVYFSYPKEESCVFNNLNLKINLDRFWGLTGDNGNGKTTLLKLIIGYLVPDHGDVYINNINVKNIKRKWFSDNFACYYPEMKITNAITVKEFLTVDQLDSSVDYTQKMFDVLKEVGLFDKFKGSDLSTVVLDPGYPGGTDLSSGQAQRLLIARLIMNIIAGARYILADEMTSNISFNDQPKLICLLKKYSNKAIIIAHNPNLITLCDEVILCKENNLKIIKKNVGVL